MTKHIYRHGAKYRERRKFEERYGKKKGRYIYGAVVGKLYRSRHHHSKR
ncbi:MAG: hypothetical protein JRM78_03225 [Nitrososphaerota archaeon]|nr:hypothetical protein [Nitrososphaerota archaeon]MDG7047739.1 hypothetical protein [Nitrososphaerota archaeon]